MIAFIDGAPVKNEQQLWEEYKSTRSQNSRDALFEKYINLIWFERRRIVRKNPQYEEIEDDLYQEGAIAMIDEMGKYDPFLGVKFEDFARKRIIGAMFDFIRSKMNILPRNFKRARNEVERAKSLFYALEGREPTNEELEKQLNETVRENPKNTLRKSRASVASLDYILSREYDIEQQCEDKPENPIVRRDLIDSLLRGLKPKERFTIFEYYINERCMEKIGNTMGLSQSRVGQIHSQAINLLKEKASEYSDFAA